MMVFSLFGVIWFVGSAILTLPLGIFSIYLWNKNRNKKYSLAYLIGGIFLILVFLLLVMGIFFPSVPIKCLNSPC
jgi:hypothetical protein